MPDWGYFFALILAMSNTLLISYPEPHMMLFVFGFLGWTIAEILLMEHLIMKVTEYSVTATVVNTPYIEPFVKVT